jgi:GH35 family endo-1,4-beta-xylanase
MYATLQIYRNDLPHLAVNIDENTFFSQVVMGEHIISSSFISSEPLDIDEGDYVLFGGERFNVNKTLPPLRKSAKNGLEYTLNLQGYIYDLHYTAYRHLGSAEFELFATAYVFIGTIVECLNRISSGWSIGVIDATEPKLIQFFESGKGFSCKGALIKIAEAFGLEFWLTGKTLNLTAQAGVDTNITFEQGRGRGLYEIFRGEISNELYFNRLYIEGSTRNIPVGYRGGMKRLQIDVPHLQLEIPAGKRIRESPTVFVDDIFPKRVGTITAVSVDQITITDTTIDFDLNGQRIEGQKSTVEMLTGENSGRSFEIDKYDHATKSIKLVKITETNGEVRPNTVFKIKAGDQYFFAGIKLPDTYVAAAESELKVRGMELLQKAARYVPPYTVRVSDKFMRDNGLKINAGDRVRLKDAALGIDVKIRVSSVKFPLVDPYSVELLISDVIPYSPEEKTIIEIDKVKKETVVVRKRSTEMSRLNWKATAELATLLDTLRAEMLLIMVEGGQYNTGIIAEVDKDGFATTAGEIIHDEYLDNGGKWNASPFSGLIPTSSAHYVYFKADRNTMAAEVVLSATKIAVNETAGFYYFPFGVISSIINNTRVFTSTKGYTRITGGNITTGRLMSNDGLTWLDLDTGEIRGKFTFTSGADVEETIENVAAEKVNELADGLGALAYKNAVEKAQLGSTIIQGGYIRSELIEVINLVARNLITGKWRITAAANNIRMVDEETNKIIMLLDDDSAYEGFYFSLSPPMNNPDGSPDPNYLGNTIRVVNGADVMYYKYAKRGPGMTIGTPGTATTSIGRAGVTSTDNSGVIQMETKIDFETGRGSVNHNVSDGLFYTGIENKTSGLRESVQFKIEVINGKRCVVADEVQVNPERMYNPNVVADAGDNGTDNGGVLNPVDPPDENPPTTSSTLNGNGFPFGVMVKGGFQTYIAGFEVAKFHARSLTEENNWKTKNRLSTDDNGDMYNSIVSNALWAKANGKKITIHTGWWPGDANEPSRIKAFYADPTIPLATKEAEFKWMIQAPLLFIKNRPDLDGIVENYDVFNEAFNEGPVMNSTGQIWKPSVVTDALGVGCYKRAIQYAKEADPRVNILINDYGIEHRWVKLDAWINFANECKSEGIPLDGFGFQLHAQASVGMSGIVESLQRMVAIGMKIRFSEVALSMLYMEGSEENFTPEMEEIQANKYVQLIDVIMDNVPKTLFIELATWGIVEDDYMGNHINEHAMLFNNDGTPKLAYLRMVARMKERNSYSQLPL